MFRPSTACARPASITDAPRRGPYPPVRFPCRGRGGPLRPRRRPAPRSGNRSDAVRPPSQSVMCRSVAGFRPGPVRRGGGAGIALSISCANLARTRVPPQAWTGGPSHGKAGRRPNPLLFTTPAVHRAPRSHLRSGACCFGPSRAVRASISFAKPASSDCGSRQTRKSHSPSRPQWLTAETQRLAA